MASAQVTHVIFEVLTGGSAAVTETTTGGFLGGGIQHGLRFIGSPILFITAEDQPPVMRTEPQDSGS